MPNKRKILMGLSAVVIAVLWHHSSSYRAEEGIVEFNPLALGSTYGNPSRLCKPVYVGGKHPVAYSKVGVFTGVQTNQTKVFHNIKYGEQQRFHSSTMYSPPSSTQINATDSKLRACYQSTSKRIHKSSLTEDCLVLHIWTPLDAALSNSTGQYAPKEELKRVMFWIHGGMFIEGAGGQYSGDSIAHNTDTIHVSINYRLGIFGFLTNTNFSDTMDGVGLGIRDQQLALRWVSENIRAFGGDPDQVTIYGESAGAESVAVHLALAGSGDPVGRHFHAAIMQSNPAGITYFDIDVATTMLTHCQWEKIQKNKTKTDQWISLAESGFLIGKADLTFQDVIHISSIWGPRIANGSMGCPAGRICLTKQPIESFIQGEVLDVPMIIGTLATEGGLFTALMSMVADAFRFLEPSLKLNQKLTLERMLGTATGDTSVQKGVLADLQRIYNVQDLNIKPYPIIKQYAGFMKYGENLAPFMTDYIWRCINYRMAAGMAKYRKVYFYQLDMAGDEMFADFWGAPKEAVLGRHNVIRDECSNKTCHSAEISALFHHFCPIDPGSAVHINPHTYPPAPEALSRRMQHFWTQLLPQGGSGSLNYPDPAISWKAFGQDGDNNVLNLIWTDNLLYNMSQTPLQNSSTCDAFNDQIGWPGKGYHPGMGYFDRKRKEQFCW